MTLSVERDAMLGSLGSALRTSFAVVVAVAGMSQTCSAQKAAGPNGTTPFAQTYRRPTVSPYMQLQQQGMNPLQNQNVYQTVVQPLMQQQQQQIEQLSQSRRLGNLQNQVQQIQRDTSARQIDESIRPTGHRATYMNYSHYYGQSGQR